MIFLNVSSEQKNQEKFSSRGCNGRDGEIGYHVCTIPPSLTVKNTGKDCWDPCNQQSGPCGPFCGRDGFCCKKGEVENGCNGNTGGNGRHECVVKPRSFC